MTDKRIVLTTAGSREEAERIAQALVKGELAACVNVVGPMTSIYRWQGKVDRADEFLLVIKTTAAVTKRVEAKIRGLHSYELPECVVLPIEAGSDKYLDWITQNVAR